jgi:UDP-N-acetylmuramate: L-alanyl-gamma-D-glutamyl-meso-diaminopimelate ligase
MRVHFIAIGGSAMHNLAIALHKKGYIVTGSDDEIFEPSKGRLEKYKLLPNNQGWDENKISTELDAVIVGMHARIDNPELIKAQSLGLNIYSYPEYLYEQSKDKIRIVIGGSHGKTTITSMIIHVLNYYHIDCDYMVGAQLEGFEVMVKLSEDAAISVLEGDEYLTSPIDRRPKFHLYRPNIALISGIAWDHINVFPTFENYMKQFDIFLDQIVEEGSVIYCRDDVNVKRICESNKNNIHKFPYSLPSYIIKDNITHILHKNKEYPLQIFGKHNLLNLNGARLVCKQLGIDDEKFYDAICTFKGASKRLELVKRNNSSAFYKDFAHAPSKLKATINAVKEQYPQRKLIACIELHTFSSLNEKFLKEYHNSMSAADTAIVYYNQHTLEHKKLPFISPEQVKAAFGGSNLVVYNDTKKLMDDLIKMNFDEKNLLMMSSGNFDGINLNELAEKIIKST